MEAPSSSCKWLAIGDWGSHNDSLIELAKSMGEFARTNEPQFIIANGDNFYPRGVKHVEYIEPYEREENCPMKFSNFYSFEFAYWRKGLLI
jgi:hypothetical protein